MLVFTLYILLLAICLKHKGYIKSVNIVNRLDWKSQSTGVPCWFSQKRMKLDLRVMSLNPILGTEFT